MWSETPNRLSLNSIDRQRSAMNAPAGPRAQVFVVVAQVPDQVGDLIGVDAEMMCDAGDSAQCIVGVRAWRVDLADDRVLGAGKAR